jgi:hypothetical protein
MTAVDSDDDCTNGKRYTKTLPVIYQPDGTLKYCFKASDGTDDATGTPTNEDGSHTILVANLPLLSWTGEANYSSDGVNPDSGVSGSSFEFRVEYADADNIAPTTIQVWVDINDTGTGAYEGTEQYDMTEVNAGDTIYTDGKLYTKTLNISSAGDDSIYYRFYATDGTDDAVGYPTSNNTVEINNPPTLAWTGETNYTADGVNPDIDTSGSSFTFRVEYTDTDDDAPSSIQVWIDEDDSGTYESGEKYDMTVDGGDGDYTNGELYTKALTLTAEGDGALNYRFYAKDDFDDATGDPVSDKTVSVSSSNVLLVPAEYGTIQAAINAAAVGNIVRVSDGTYSENIDFIGKAITVESVNGAASTTIQGDGANAAVVTFISGELSSAVLDGFTLDNQNSGGSNARGVYISGGASPTVQNCIIENNDIGFLDGGAGVLVDSGSGATIVSTVIQNNTVQDEVGGGGIYMKGTLLTLSDSTVKGNNAASTNGGAAGGGIRIASGSVDITGSIIESNTTPAGLGGGGIYMGGASSVLTMSKSFVMGNRSYGSSNPCDGGGIRISAGTATITNSVIAGNTADNVPNGMAVAFMPAAPRISITALSGATHMTMVPVPRKYMVQLRLST